MKSRIITSAPGKLMLFGEHAVVYGRGCIVTAVGERIKTKVEIAADDEIIIDAPDVGVKNFSEPVGKLGKGKTPKGARFLVSAIRCFFERYNLKSGLKVETSSDFSSEFGFGSSSGVTVAVLKAMSELFGKRMSKKELFDLAYRVVLDVQGLGSGFDLAAAIWGGTIHFVTGGRVVDPLDLELLPLVVGFTGVKADTATLVRKVARLKESHPEIVDNIFNVVNLTVERAKTALEQGDFEKVGELMNLNQGLLESLGVNTKVLSDLIFAARGAGAYGAKLSGAGGGDCMIAFAPKYKLKKVKASINKAGGKVLNVKLNAEGVRVEG